MASFKQLLRALGRAEKAAPRIMGQTAKQFTRERFRQQNWVDNRTESWPRRSKKAKRDKGRALLVDSGDLRRSVRVIKKGPNYAVVGSSLPYARAHNDGARIRGAANVPEHKRKTKNGGKTIVKAHRRKMDTRLPRRRFIGKSRVLARRAKRALAAELVRQLKRL